MPSYTAVSYQADVEYRANSWERRIEVAKTVVALRVQASKVSQFGRQITENERKIVCDKE